MGALTTGGESDPVIPPAQQRRSLRLLNDINRHVQVMRRFDRRINNLYLFRDYTHDAGHQLRMSVQEYRDHPLVQLLLERRDRYLAAGEEIARFEEMITAAGSGDEIDHNARLSAITSVAKLRLQQSREMESMEQALISIRREMGVHLQTCQRFVADMVKASQVERMVQHKLGRNATDLSDDAIDAELAKDDG